VTWAPRVLVGIALKTLRTFSGNVLFRIPEVEMARAALEIEQNHALGFPAPAPVLAEAAASMFGTKNAGKAQPSMAETADTKLIRGG